MEKFNITQAPGEHSSTDQSKKSIMCLSHIASMIVIISMQRAIVEFNELEGCLTKPGSGMREINVVNNNNHNHNNNHHKNPKKKKRATQELIQNYHSRQLHVRLSKKDKKNWLHSQTYLS